MKIYRKIDNTGIGIISLFIILGLIFFNLYNSVASTNKINRQLIESQQQFEKAKIKDLTRIIKEDKLDLQELIDMRRHLPEMNSTDFDAEFYKNIKMSQEKIDYLQAELKAIKKGTQSWQKFVETNSYPHLQKFNTDL